MRHNIAACFVCRANKSVKSLFIVIHVMQSVDLLKQPEKSGVVARRLGMLISFINEGICITAQIFVISLYYGIT